MYAWIENGVVREITDKPELFTPDVARMFSTEVPNDVIAGATLVDGVWTNPVIVVDTPVVVKMLTEDLIRSSMSLAEKVKWDSNVSPIPTIKSVLPVDLASADAADVLSMLELEGIVSATTKAKIVAA